MIINSKGSKIPTNKMVIYDRNEMREAYKTKKVIILLVNKTL